MNSLKGKLPGIVVLSALVAGLTWTVTHDAHRADSILAAKVERIEAKADEASKHAAALAEYADRVIDLPEDAKAWHVSVFTHNPPTASERQILTWFETDGQLSRLKAQTHFHHFTPASSVYGRYPAITGGGLPAIAVQDAKGAVVYKASGANAPRAPWPLVKGIKDCILAHCPHLRPCPKPEPQPAPAPGPEPGPPSIPDIVGPPDEVEPVDDASVKIALAAFVVVFVASFAFDKIRAANRG
jgi:hypothetical protein